MLGFATALALLTGVIFGAAPAWFATRTDPIDALPSFSAAPVFTPVVPAPVMVPQQESGMPKWVWRVIAGGVFERLAGYRLDLLKSCAWTSLAISISDWRRSFSGSAE